MIEPIIYSLAKVIVIMLVFVLILLFLFGDHNNEPAEDDRPYTEDDLFVAGWKKVYTQNGWEWEKDK